MNFSTPIKMHDYPAESLAFDVAGRYWAIASGADLFILEAQTMLVSFFMPGTAGSNAKITAAGNVLKGNIIGNITDKSLENISLERKNLDENSKHLAIDNYVIHQISWHPDGLFFVAALKPFISKDRQQNNLQKKDYPVVAVNVKTTEIHWLHTGTMPCDAIEVSNNYIVIIQEKLLVYDRDFLLLKTKPSLSKALQIDRAIIFNDEQNVVCVNALGASQSLGLPDLQQAVEIKIDHYNTAQPVTINNSGLMVTGNNSGELNYYQLNNNSCVHKGNFLFDGIITALAIHPTKQTLVVGLNGNTYNGTYWLNWT